MGEQAWLAVTFRCWQCHRRWGPAPVLAYVERNSAAFGGWDVQVTRRVGHAPTPGGPPVGNDGGVPRGRVAEPVVGVSGKRTRLLSIPGEIGVQLICPSSHCEYKPREARRELVKLAAEAVERGERVVYV